MSAEKEEIENTEGVMLKSDSYSEESKKNIDKLCSDSENNEGNLGHLSKKQLRKLRKQEKWQQIKGEKRALEKEKKKQKKREALANGLTLGPTRKKLKNNTMEKSECKIRVVIDCFFDSYMSDKDIMKLTKQIQFCYSSNRRADNPLQYYVSGVHGQMKERLQRIGDFVNWDVHFSEENYFDIFPKEDMIYLSSDSPNVLQDLDPSKAYIIGGLVDHNHHKGLCHQLAEERGVNHAQLPLTEYLDMKSRKVLTINHVFDILLRYTETKDWQKAFFSVLPQRKGAKLKSDCDENEPSKTTSEEGEGDLSKDVTNSDQHPESKTTDNVNRECTSETCESESSINDDDDSISQEKECTATSVDREQSSISNVKDNSDVLK